jgi:hypothetical protein
MNASGTAIGVVFVNWRNPPARVPVLKLRNSHSARRAWRTFCRQGTNFIEHYECCGTNKIGSTNLSPVTKLVAGTGAVSRNNLSRSQKLVKVQDFNCMQMRVSGCKRHYKSVSGAGAKAKSVTNKLPILSVLGGVILFLIYLLIIICLLIYNLICSETIP